MNNLIKKIKHFSKNKETCLTIVGVGPGDPSLLTLAAVKAIKKANLVAYPVAKEGGKSIAADIASKLIKRKRVLPIEFAMTNDPGALMLSWKDASSYLVQALEDYRQVTLLTQGDASLYSTSAYIAFDFKINYPEHKLKIIPGINSFSAAAAISSYPLALQKEQLLISPAPDNKEALNKMLDEAFLSNRVIVFLKLGTRWEWIRRILEDRNLLDQTLFAQKVGLLDQEIVFARKVPACSKPYFSLLIIRNKFPKIMP